jgi:hypothetical protein
MPACAGWEQGVFDLVAVQENVVRLAGPLLRYSEHHLGRRR